MAATGKTTNLSRNKKYPDIFYETQKDAAERAGEEREARLAAEARAEAAESREREFLAEIDRLRSLQSER